MMVHYRSLTFGDVNSQKEARVWIQNRFKCAVGALEMRQSGLRRYDQVLVKPAARSLRLVVRNAPAIEMKPWVRMETINATA